MSQQAATNVVPARPTRAEMVPFAQAIKDPKSHVASLLQHPEMMLRMRQALPRHLSPERMVRVCALALQRTPKLAECDRMTLLGALLTCGSLGLEPNTVLGHAYLIPFGKACTLIIGYKGFVDLARRSGHIATVHADVVYASDEFDFEYGSSGKLRHVPSGNREGDWIYAYAYARMKDGSDQYEVMTRTEVLRIRNSSQGYQRDKSKSPWTNHEAEMAKKTALRRLAKWLPLSVEFATAAALDEMSDAGKADLSHLGEATDVLAGVEQMALEAPSDEPAAAPQPAPPADPEPAPAAAPAQTVTDAQPDPLAPIRGALAECKVPSDVDGAEVDLSAYLEDLPDQTRGEANQLMLERRRELERLVKGGRR